jgi:hypothetical protein
MMDSLKSGFGKQKGKEKIRSLAERKNKRLLAPWRANGKVLLLKINAPHGSLL